MQQLKVRHGLSPDLLNLLFFGQTSLQGPATAGGKVTVINSNSLAVATASIGYSDAGHSNVNYNAGATDDGSGNIFAINMRNQAQTQQIELQGTSQVFSLALELSAVRSYDPNGDDDGDGLPNQWEIDHGLNPNDPTGANGANGDPDGDGMTNMQEYIAGTHPKDSSSYFHIISIAPSGGGYLITWTSAAGKSYNVYATTDLAAGFGATPLNGSPIPSAGATTSYTDSSVAGTRKYYKVKVLP